MKIDTFWSSFSRKSILQVIVIAFVLAFLCIPQLYANNEKLHNIMINLASKSILINDFFSEIEKQSTYLVVYDANKLKKGNKVNFSKNRNSLDKLLNEFADETNYNYELTNNYIVISEKNNQTKLQQTNNKISGTVVDSSGEPIIGATISLKDKKNTIGTVSDIDGNFVLNAPVGSILEISYLGYISQDVKVSSLKNKLKIVLKDDSKTLDEVVVIGYGTQKKVNLTGAVSSVKMSEATSSRSISNSTSALQGVLPGLAVVQNSGGVGTNGVNLTIRGMGSVNNSNPLIVVDGMPDASLSNINIEDIESVSVLKDAASSAIYGSRAANGVILITTKTGSSQKIRTTLSTSLTVGTPATNVYPFMDDYPRLLTAFTKNQAATTLPENYNYRKGSIDEWMAMAQIDPRLFPNTNWWDVVTRNSQMIKTDASVSGGSDKFSFYFSLGWLTEDGLQMQNSSYRYNGRFNTEYKVKDNLKIGVKISGYWKNRDYLNGDFGTFLCSPGITPYDSETGRYGGLMAYQDLRNESNPYANYVNTQRHSQEQNYMTNAYISWEAIKGLTAKVDYTLNHYNTFGWDANMPFTLYDFQHDTDGTTIVQRDAAISNSIGLTYKTQMNANLNYHLNINKVHDINILALYSEEYWHSRSLSASRNDRIHTSLHEINAALTNVVSNSGSSSAEGMRSFVGRLNYSAFDKYLFEFSMRADGSSRFIGNKRWGYFPSFALGWRFTQEKFMKDFSSILSNGKLRFSWGKLGNNSGVGTYEQKSTLSATNYIINGSVASGFINKKLINPDLSWEATTVKNIGVDLGFFNNRLSMELDYYDRLTSDMLRPSDISIFLSGYYSAPRKNIGKLRNRGLEANVTWNDNYRGLNYKLNFNVAYNKNRLEQWNEYLNKGSVFLQMPYGFLYGYEDSGIAQSWADIYNATPQGASPGDVLLKDVNGDGRITSDDRVAHPNINTNNAGTNFGFNMSVDWKGFDLSALFNGVLGRKNYWLSSYYNGTSMNYGQNITWYQYNNQWSWDNRSTTYPRQSASGNSRTSSTMWLYSMDYLRMKNLQLGYTLKNPFMKKMGFDSIRIYGSAENLFTITNWPGIDPERTSADDLYPLVKSFSLGISVNI